MTWWRLAKGDVKQWQIFANTYKPLCRNRHCTILLNVIDAALICLVFSAEDKLTFGFCICFINCNWLIDWTSTVCGWHLCFEFQCCLGENAFVLTFSALADVNQSINIRLYGGYTVIRLQLRFVVALSATITYGIHACVLVFPSTNVWTVKEIAGCHLRYCMGWGVIFLSIMTNMLKLSSSLLYYCPGFRHHSITGWILTWCVLTLHCRCGFQMHIDSFSVLLVSCFASLRSNPSVNNSVLPSVQ